MKSQTSIEQEISESKKKKSENRHFQYNESIEEIEFKNEKNLQRSLRQFYERHSGKDDHFDITFIISGPSSEKRIKSQRYIMASRSEKLYEFLYIENKDVSEINVSGWFYPEAYKQFVQYCLSGIIQCAFSESVPLLYLAHKYELDDLKIPLSKKIMELISYENCYETFHFACNFGLENIEKRCHHFFEYDPVKSVLNRHNVNQLPQNAFEDVLLIANFAKHRRLDDHITIYESIIQWSKANNLEDYKSVSSEMILKYVDFKRFKGSERLKIGQEGVIDLMKLFAIQSFCEDRSSDISQFVPAECATLSTLKYKGISMSTYFNIRRKEAMKKKEEEELQEQEGAGEDKNHTGPYSLNLSVNNNNRPRKEVKKWDNTGFDSMSFQTRVLRRLVNKLII